MMTSTGRESYKNNIVRIYTSFEENIANVVGAGCLVSKEYIVTCAHVVADALGIPRNTQDTPSGLVKLDFPFPAEEKNKKKFHAKVIVWQSQSSPVYSYGEDIAVLQLEEKLPSNYVSCKLSLADTTNDEFSVVGFPQGRNPGAITKGKLLGTLGNGLVQMVVESLSLFYVEPGFSGAPVWDEKLASFVGIVTSSELDAHGRPFGELRENVKVAYMIPTKMLVDTCSFLNKSTLYQPETIEVFFSYAHKDEELKNELVKHLSLLKRCGVITAWHDREIIAGGEWQNEIDSHLNTASVILLLISSDFIASDYCYDIELKRAMERHETGEACVIPVILREVDWKGAVFGKLQALPKNAKPITNWENPDEAFADVAKGIRQAVEHLRR